MFVKSFLSVLILCALASASQQDLRGGGFSGGGNFGGHGGFGCSCLVVAATETNCTGVSGKSCSDSASLLALVVAGTTSVPVCSSLSTVPITQTINFRLPIQTCRRCTCFTASVSEARDCATLNADTTFVKNGCSDQTSLAALAKNGNQARICAFDRLGSLIQSATVNILAGVGGRF